MRPKADQNSAWQIPTPATPCQAPGSSDGIVSTPVANVSSSVTCGTCGLPFGMAPLCLKHSSVNISYSRLLHIPRSPLQHRFHLCRSCNGFSGLSYKESDAVPHYPASEFWNFSLSLHTFT